MLTLFGGLALFNQAFLVRRLVFPLLGFQFGLYYDWVALLFTVVEEMETGPSTAPNPRAPMSKLCPSTAAFSGPNHVVLSG